LKKVYYPPVTEHLRSTAVERERAILVGVLLEEPADQEHPLAELIGLATTAGSIICSEITQRRESPDQKTYLGKGKLIAVQQLVAHHDADVVLFDNDLTPAQTRNLEQALGVKVLDRSEVILDIFAARAKTHEARLAVELAQLEYSLPRLKRMWTHLSRLKMGIGMRGPGEKQLEVDRRLVEKRIYDLRQLLATIHGRKEREVSARSEQLTVSLIGYTNAGKSTLLNLLTGSDELVEDKLFATLDTRTRRWRVPGCGWVLLSDTVGFIRDLPHHLIASFKATLEETRRADLLIHVADASSRLLDSQVCAVRKVLADLGIADKETLLVLNKLDAVEQRSDREQILSRYPHAIGISARTHTGIAELISATRQALSYSFCDVSIRTDASNGRLLAFLAATGNVLSRQFTESSVVLHCKLSRAMLGRIPPGEATIVPSLKSHSITDESRLMSPRFYDAQTADYDGLRQPNATHFFDAENDHERP